MANPRPDQSEPIRLGALTFSVEHRGAVPGVRGEGGPTLRVSGPDGGELLRFDCFRVTPHYHVANEPDRVFFGPVADPVTWTLEELERDLPSYVRRAGFEVPAAEWTREGLDDALARVERAMRNPEAQLNDLDVALLRTRHGEKWATYPPDILPAWVAEMDFPLAEPIRVTLERAVARWDVGYPINPRATGLPQCFHDRMQRLYGWSPEIGRIEVLSDVVQALFIALEAFTEQGEGAIVQTPIYPPFLGAVRETGRRLVEHRFAAPSRGGGGYELDLDALRAIADDRTRLLLLCNPHNPTGRVFTRTELVGLAELARKRDWIVVVDEIHQDLVFDGHEHIPFATLDSDAAARTVTLTSATKAFNIPGLRCSVAHFGSATLKRRFNEAFHRHARGGLGTLGIHATLAAWQHADPWLDEVRTYLQRNRDFVTAYLASEIPDIVFQPPEATYLAWLDCRDLGLPENPTHFFYERAKVALSAGEHFGPGWEGFARLNFGTSRAILTEVLEKLAKAVHDR